MTDEADPARGKYGPNTAPDGSYVVGKGKPPEHGKFQKGDQRKRGRRSKGTRNLATDFREELHAGVTVTVNGQPRRVSKQRSLVMRLLDNAGRGQQGALKLALEYGDRLATNVDQDAPKQETDAKPLTHIDCLTEEELDQLDALLAKACGQELPIIPQVSNPFAHISNPNDPRNLIEERTVEGLHYRRCSVIGHADELIHIEPHAYWSAALRRRPGCNRQF